MLTEVFDMKVFILLASLLLCSSARKQQHVYPIILEARSTSSKLVLRINDKITLNLERSEVLADELHFVTVTTEEHEIETINTASVQQNIYHDSNERSSIMLQRKDGVLYVEGIVNRKLRIKPIPEGERSAQGHTLHSLYEVQERGENLAKMGAYYRRPPGNVRSPYWGRRPTATRPERYTDSQTTTSTASTMTGRRPANSFVVDLHIISDQEHNQNFDSKEDLIGYLAIMVNAVTLRYLEIKTPSITFRIVGVTMSKADVFLSHILGTIEAYETLAKLEKYYNDDNIPGNPDVVFLLTNRDMSTARGTSLDKNIAGLANVAGVCTRHRVAMAEDVAPSFDGVFGMAHEIGHSLGARHDPRGTGECAWRLGYLMSYEDGGPNKYRLSTCSMEAIKINTEKLSGDCLGESTTRMPHTVKPHVMPGQQVSAQYYCMLVMKRTLKQKRISGDAFPKTPPELTKECKMKCCYSQGRQTWCQKVDLLDGMECEHKSTCMKGVCGANNRVEK
ncbi:venom metalloproteinase antarease-like TtrivMP_A isoform X2 [Rhipicephalus microplus]|uniref:venom metalloproteinase antarease-like TtrivMP_A isoform X2 n=1 Tax=Rhipicephalus microplus TaxID=6941 RepID=UPI003F6D4CCF